MHQGHLGFPFAFGSSQGGVALPEGDYFVPPGVNEVEDGQHIIARYADGDNHPAGMLVGFGPQSMLCGTSATDSADVPAVVITEDVLEELSQWYGTTEDLEPAVLQPIVSNLTVAGYSTNNFGAGGDVGNLPYVDNIPAASHPDKYMGLRLCGSGGVVSNVTVSYIPGTAIEIKRPVSERNGQMHPLDQELWTLSNATVRRAFRGIWYDALDGTINGKIEIENCRDYGLKIGSEFTGRVMFEGANIHTYGVGYAADPNGGPGVWIAGDCCNGGSIKAETGTLGLLITSNQNRVKGFWSKDTSVAAASISGAYNSVSDFWIEDCDLLGFLITGQDTTLENGKIDLVGTGLGISIGNSNRQRIHNLKINAFGQASAKGILPTVTLNYCTIDFDIIGGAYGIDLFPGSVSRIGSGNTIHCKSTNGTVAPIILPTGWTTTPTSNPGDNRVFINGVQWYAPEP